jgi:hypothetical protein
MRTRAKNKMQAPQANKRDNARVLVRLDEVLPVVRQRIEAEWDAREAKARHLKAIRGTAGHTDGHAAPSEPEALAGGAMVRKDGAVVSDVAPGKSRRDVGGEFVRPDEDDLKVADGVEDNSADGGAYIRKPDPKPRWF